MGGDYRGFTPGEHWTKPKMTEEMKAAEAARRNLDQLEREANAEAKAMAKERADKKRALSRPELWGL